MSKKGKQGVQIKQGIWCPRCAGVREEKGVFRWVGPDKQGRVRAAAITPLFDPEHEGWRLLQRLIFPKGRFTWGARQPGHYLPDSGYECIPARANGSGGKETGLLRRDTLGF